MKKIIFILLIFISSCSTDSPLSIIITPDTSPMWRQFSYDARHTGNPNSPRVPLTPVINGVVEWVDTVTTGFPNDGTDCSIDSKGNIYFLSTAVPNAHVIKYNIEGKIIWEKDTLGIDGFFGIAISTDESRIYYSDFGHITCRDSAGNLIWRLNERGAGNPIIDNENNLLINNNGFLTKISSIGVKLWTLPDVNGYIYSPVFDKDYNIYFPGIKNDHNVLVKVNKNGVILWIYDFNNYIPNTSRSVVIDGYNNIYYSHDKLYAMSKDGVLKWQKSFGGETTPAITKDNRLIVNSWEGFTMLDTSGTTVWSQNTGANSNQSYLVLDDEDNIYFNYSVAGLSVISLDKFGNTRWNLQNITGGSVIPGPVLSPLARLITYPKRPARVYSIK